ncbi:MAG: prepilin-type N-terminal cleavage/methylation domain-containing protein [Nevskia sp.]|nr:prepilin-type N-terminal cleavage/methylation domain-containing protein [Nevskia sp.]
MQFHRGRPLARARGLTLTEILIVLVILALLATFGLPTFLKYSRQGKLSTAQAALRRIAAEESRWLESHRTYAPLSQLGYPVDSAMSALYLDTDGQLSGNASQDSIYRVSLKLDAPSGTAGSMAYYLITAEPINSQSKETACGILSLASTGQVGASGMQGEATCWGK